MKSATGVEMKKITIHFIIPLILFHFMVNLPCSSSLNDHEKHEYEAYNKKKIKERIIVKIKNLS